jgi:tripartite-type tricarboxylate transporter receptor subunit TctC
MFSRFALAAAMCVALALAARADGPAEFFEGKQITLIVGNAPGGVYDVNARLIAKHLGRYVPGMPEIVVQNMPGGNSLKAVNYLYNTAARDGTVIGTFSRNVPLIGVLGGPNVQFDARKFTWLGSSSSFVNDAYILIVRKDAPVKTIDEARRADLPGLVLAGSAEGGTGNDIPIILRDTIGLHVKQVVGYPDTPAIMRAIEKGEVHGRTVDLSTLKALRPEWLKPDSGYRVLVQFARATRHQDLPDVPTARELAKNEAARALIALAELPYALSRPFAAPPHVPADRAAVLREAFLAVHRDQAYLEEAARLKLEVSPIGGDGILTSIDRIAAAPVELLEYVRKLLAESKGG